MCPPMEYIESTIYQVMFMYHNPMNCFMEYRYKLAALANTYFMNDLPCQHHRLPYTPRLKFLVIIIIRYGFNHSMSDERMRDRRSKF
jgi:hypothetical protein